MSFSRVSCCTASATPDETTSVAPAALVEVAAERDFQYCTEVLVRGDQLPSSNEVRAALQASQIEFQWHTGDVLALDNMLVAHGRSPYQGPRKILVAMAHPHRAAARGELPQ